MPMRGSSQAGAICVTALPILPVMSRVCRALDREVAGNDTAGNPGVPTDSQGAKFLGWFYRDASGVEHAFDYKTTEFDSDTEVYAKWDAKTVVYHNGAGASYIQAVAQSAASAAVLSFADVAKQNDAFNIPGKEFSSWNTAPDGSDQTVDAASALAFASGETQKDLYAQYTQDSYRVGFSANGGTFSDSSIFKQNPDVFTIEHDATGGEVAYLKATARIPMTGSPTRRARARAADSTTTCFGESGRLTVPTLKSRATRSTT
jgi:hypothetical protein